ncbi:DJ-1/PfpI family protein [Paraburkholderia bannensis]|uniref:DJ-1/PfpI family protein n=1 Tax=Paraburkholderia bannensis TaxID=765414 RepID=UPI002AB74FBE|nr:DJ-1/PfpI family protein [Paraburkholderia bannensis]
MQIAMLLYAGFRLLDVGDSLEVFELANRLCGRTFYETKLLGPHCGTVVAASGVALATTACYSRAASAFDIVMVPGSRLDHTKHDNRMAVDWLRDTGAATPRLASVSSGAHLIARAGLANGRWLATHPHDVRRLSDEHPSAYVLAIEGCLKDGNLYSSGSERAGLHLAVALVREDLGPEAADRIGTSLGLQLLQHTANALNRTRQ